MLSQAIAFLFESLEKLRWVAEYRGYRERYNIHPTFLFNGEGIKMYGDGEIHIGANSYIGRYSSIQALKGYVVKIGQSTAISHYFMAYTTNRRADQDFSKTRQSISGNVIIGNNCWIGAYVFVKQGVTIGDNVVIGAHSVVTHDIPSYSIALGCPAKVKKQIGDKDPNDCN